MSSEQQVIIPIDMEFRKQAHGEVDHFQTFRNDNGFPFETCKPMTIGRMIALNRFCLTFAHHEPPLRNNGTIDLRGISIVDCHLPFLESLVQFLEGPLIPMPTFPVKSLSGVTIKSLPDPQLSGLFLR